MKYWIDTEFIAKPFTIDLVSIGLVAEDGREFYAESSEVDWSKASPWMLENVRPQLEGKGVSLEDLRALPSNRLEALGGDRSGQYSIRINAQWRICLSGKWTSPGQATSRSWTITNEQAHDTASHPSR